MVATNGNPVAGPDIYDLTSTMQVIEVTHRVTLEVVLRTNKAPFATSVMVECRASPKDGGLSCGDVMSLTLVRPFPGNGSKCLIAQIYAMLLGLDHACSKDLWEQKKLAND